MLLPTAGAREAMTRHARVPDTERRAQVRFYGAFVALVGVEKPLLSLSPLLQTAELELFLLSLRERAVRLRRGVHVSSSHTDGGPLLL